MVEYRLVLISKNGKVETKDVRGMNALIETGTFSDGFIATYKKIKGGFVEFFLPKTKQCMYNLAYHVPENQLDSMLKNTTPEYRLYCALSNSLLSSSYYKVEILNHNTVDHITVREDNGNIHKYVDYNDMCTNVVNGTIESIKDIEVSFNNITIPAKAPKSMSGFVEVVNKGYMSYEDYYNLSNELFTEYIDWIGQGNKLTYYSFTLCRTQLLSGEPIYGIETVDHLWHTHSYYFPTLVELEDYIEKKDDWYAMFQYDGKHKYNRTVVDTDKSNWLVQKELISSYDYRHMPFIHNLEYYFEAMNKLNCYDVKCTFEHFMLHGELNQIGAFMDDNQHFNGKSPIYNWFTLIHDYAKLIEYGKPLLHFVDNVDKRRHVTVMMDINEFCNYLIDEYRKEIR